MCQKKERKNARQCVLACDGHALQIDDSILQTENHRKILDCLLNNFILVKSIRPQILYFIGY